MIKPPGLDHQEFRQAKHLSFVRTPQRKAWDSNPQNESPRSAVFKTVPCPDGAAHVCPRPIAGSAGRNPQVLLAARPPSRPVPATCP